MFNNVFNNDLFKLKKPYIAVKLLSAAHKMLGHNAI